MIKSKLPLYMLCVCGIVALSTGSAFAGLITGSQLNVSGDALVSAISITWQCDQGSPTDPRCAMPAAAGHGDFTVSSSTGSFAQYNNSFGLIANINNLIAPLNTTGAPLPFVNFMQFKDGNLTIDLTFIPLGNDPLGDPLLGCVGAAAQHCTPTGLPPTPSDPSGISAFNLDSQGGNTSATFSIVGTVYDHTTLIPTSANLSGIFTSQFANETPQQVLANLGKSNSTYSSNLSLTITSTTPEPGTLFVTGLGLVALGILKRRIVK